MSLRINDLAPNFTAQTTQGQIDFHQWIGNIVFTSQRLHAGVHYRVGLHGENRARIHEAKLQIDRA